MIMEKRKTRPKSTTYEIPRIILLIICVVLDRFNLLFLGGTPQGPWSHDESPEF